MAQLTGFSVFESIWLALFYLACAEHFNTNAARFAFCIRKPKQRDVKLSGARQTQFATQRKARSVLHRLDKQHFELVIRNVPIGDSRARNLVDR